MKRVLFLSCLLLVAASAPPVWADIDLYTQPVADLAGHYSNAGGNEIADDFTLSSDASVTGARWYGFYGADLAPTVEKVSFSVAFFSDTVTPSGAHLPGGELWRETLLAEVTTAGFTTTDPAGPVGSTVYVFEADFGPIAITHDIPMWLSIAENDSSTPFSGDTQWLWSYSTHPAGHKAGRGSAGEWYVDTGNMAFALTGDEPVVPLPGAALLGVLGLGAAGWRLRRTGAEQTL